MSDAFSSGDSQSVDTPKAILVQAAQVDAHYRLLPVVIAINGMVPPIYFLFTLDGQDVRLVAAWQGVLVVVLIARAGLRSAYRRSRPDARRARRWGHWATAGSFATGVMWGLLSLVLWPAEPAGQLLLGATLAGMSAGAVSALTPYFPPFAAFVPVALLPYVGMAIVAGPRVTAGAGFLIALFMIAMLAMARTLNRNFVESLYLRFENVELLRDLRSEQQAAEAANQAKTDFIATVSHDLRQPVHALGLFTATLRERLQEPEMRAIIERMDSSIRAMQNLFTALLDVSRLEAGVVRPRRRHFALQSLFNHVALDRELDPRARQLSLRFRADIGHCLQ